MWGSVLSHRNDFLFFDTYLTVTLQVLGNNIAEAEKLFAGEPEMALIASILWAFEVCSALYLRMLRFPPSLLLIAFLETLSNMRRHYRGVEGWEKYGCMRLKVRALLRVIMCRPRGDRATLTMTERVL